MLITITKNDTDIANASHGDGMVLQKIARPIMKIAADTKLTKNILPSNNVDTKTNSDSQEDYDQSMLDSFVPESPNQSYDVKEIINTIIDPNSFLEVQESYAQNIVIGFSKFNGEKEEGYFYDIGSIPRNYSGFVFSQVDYTDDMVEKRLSPELFYYTVKDGLLNGEFKSKIGYRKILEGKFKNGSKEGKYLEIERGYLVTREIGTFVNNVKKISSSMFISFNASK